MKRNREIALVPIAAVKVLNSRKSGKNRSTKLVRSIRELGLKKPITVSRRDKDNNFELVCGEGRLDAFANLGQSEIPAIVTDVSSEDCILIGLIENIARRRNTPIELVSEIGRLAKKYSVTEIARKLDLTQDFAKAAVYLLKHGEKRLVSAVERGIVPPKLAIEIARTKTPELQGVLLEAYAKEGHTARQIVLMRQLVEQRHRAGKRAELKSERISPEALARAYRQEMCRRQVIEQTAELAHGRLMFIIGALKSLFSERMFGSLLHDEGLDKLPLSLLRRLSASTA
jgi:ParB family chromosome partitioning protein